MEGQALPEAEPGAAEKARGEQGDGVEPVDSGKAAEAAEAVEDAREAREAKAAQEGAPEGASEGAGGGSGAPSADEKSAALAGPGSDGKPDASDNPGKADAADKSAQSGQPSKPSRPAKQAKPAKPGKPDGGAASAAPNADDNTESGYEYKDDSSYKVPEKVTLQQSLAADPEDEALKRWKAALVSQGATEIRGENDIVFESIIVTSPELPRPITIPVAEASRLAQQKQPCFVLRQGATFSIGFAWRVYNDVVMGLNCVSKIFRLGICLRKGQIMFGCFAPRLEPYTFFLPEEQAPSGALGKGMFTCRARLSDDDRRNLGGFDYIFKVDKEWAV